MLRAHYVQAICYLQVSLERRHTNLDVPKAQAFKIGDWVEAWVKWNMFQQWYERIPFREI